MERRSFLRAGLAAGVLGAGGVTPLQAMLDGPRRRPPGGPVKLSSNENPLGISPKAREAVIDGISMANRYPGEMRRQLVQALAQKHGVAVENIVVGAGSTEVLQMCVQSLATPGVRLVIPDPTFEDVPRYAGPFELPIDKVPLLSDYSHDLDRMRGHADQASGPVFVYICNPNNPTGTLTRSDAIDEWIRTADDRIWFVVDEAYYEFAAGADGYRTALGWIEKKPNVIVVRTFSKIFGMAGMRLGYAVAREETAKRLHALRSFNSANQLALFAALASLRDEAFEARSLEVNERGKWILHSALDELGLEYLPSHTNFVMHRIEGDVETYIERMGERGFRVGRPFPPMLSYNRLSIGLPDEMEMFAEALRGFRGRGWV